MASSSGAQSAFQQQFKCKECGLVLNSAESLDVHRQYHEGNLMQQWAAKAQNTNSEEKNNNMTKQQTVIKREFSTNNSLQSDNSDTQKKSPEYSRSTPEAIIYGHPPTPQSYQSASSPYQNNDNSSFSPNFHNYPGIRSGGNSPSRQQSHYQFQNFTESQQSFYNIDPNMPYGQEIHSNSTPNNPMYRYQPYGRPQYFETSKSHLVAPLASPAYPPQPTPSPSPKQCDKCGYVCESAAQLIEHNNISHPTNGPPQYDQNNQFLFNQPPIKEEDTSQNEILDLDSQKVVHPDWSNDKDGEKRPNEEPSIPHSVNAMLNTWPSEPQQPIIFQGEQSSMFMNAGGEQKMFGTVPNIQEKMFSPDQKFISPQLDNHTFMNNTVSSSNSELGTQQSYRPFEHMATGPNSVISSTQVPQGPNTTPSAGPPSSTKSASWKSNEARRPKTYNCTACNKWFTSSGHLKRHYNTTLHKNAVKSSGQPDPATMPISAHHHPARESGASKDDSQNSNSPREDSRGEDSNGMGSQYDNRLGPLPGIIQHPSNPYERQVMHHAPAIHSPLGQHHTPLANPSPLGGHMIQNSGYPNCSNGSPPNGDAGLSQPDSRGLLTMAPATHSFNMMPQHHLMPMETTQFQMYPNGSAPHVTQATDTTSNHNTTGEQIQYVVSFENQPLPSFAQIQMNRFGSFANVGGLEPVTVPVAYNFENEFIDLSEVTNNMHIKDVENDGYKLSATNTDQGLMDQQNMSQISQFSPNNISNNNNDITFGDMTQTYPAVCVSTPSTSQYISPPAASQSSISTDPQEESKENFEDGVSPTSPNVSSTVSNQDVSKTKCFDCDKEFMRPCYLTQHNKQCHNGEKPFKCEMCGKKYSDATMCAIHTKKHGGPKPHKCDRCPKMFNHKTDLRRHICCHTGKKPYACEICGKGFIRKDHMVKHKVTHTKKKEKYKEKPKIKHRAMRR